MPDGKSHDVLIVGGGIAGRTAGTFTARQGLETLVFDTGRSLLRMNAHLENFPGFPQGLNPRLLLEMLRDQAERAGCEFVEEKVTDVDRHPEAGFVAATGDADRYDYHARHVIATAPEPDEYLDALGLNIVEEPHGAYVEADPRGQTDLEGFYVSGTLSRKPLQAAVAAGHGIEVALALLEEADVDFVHDWTVPEGLFTDRGQDIPPGCEEIDEATRKERERRSMETMREYFADPHPEPPLLPPGVGDGENAPGE